jgi:KipI family sensor histidine kinase inhibitor
LTIVPASDRSLLISFGEEISVETHRRVAGLTHALVGQRGILNLHPAYTTVLVDFDPRRHTHAEVEGLVRERAASADARQVEGRLVEIPVRYDGPDLEDVARHTGLSAGEVVDRFAGAEYLVYFVGFATCFPYLGGMPPELATPRLAAPRKLVAAGSVAIGGAQAGVYPLPSPGGWRLIGRTEMRLFDPEGSPPGALRMGDRIRFVAVGGGIRAADERR